MRRLQWWETPLSPYHTQTNPKLQYKWPTRKMKISILYIKIFVVRHKIDEIMVAYSIGQKRYGGVWWNGRSWSRSRSMELAWRGQFSCTKQNKNVGSFNLWYIVPPRNIKFESRSVFKKGLKTLTYYSHGLNLEISYKDNEMKIPQTNHIFQESHSKISGRGMQINWEHKV